MQTIRYLLNFIITFHKYNLKKIYKKFLTFNLLLPFEITFKFILHFLIFHKPSRYNVELSPSYLDSLYFPIQYFAGLSFLFLDLLDLPSISTLSGFFLKFLGLLC